MVHVLGIYELYRNLVSILCICHRLHGLPSIILLNFNQPFHRHRHRGPLVLHDRCLSAGANETTCGQDWHLEVGCRLGDPCLLELEALVRRGIVTFGRLVDRSLCLGHFGAGAMEFDDGVEGLFGRPDVLGQSHDRPEAVFGRRKL